MFKYRIRCTNCTICFSRSQRTQLKRPGATSDRLWNSFGSTEEKNRLKAMQQPRKSQGPLIPNGEGRRTETRTKPERRTTESNVAIVGLLHPPLLTWKQSRKPPDGIKALRGRPRGNSPPYPKLLRARFVYLLFLIGEGPGGHSWRETTAP